MWFTNDFDLQKLRFIIEFDYLDWFRSYLVNFKFIWFIGRLLMTFSVSIFLIPFSVLSYFINLNLSFLKIWELRYIYLFSDYPILI